MKCPRCGSSNPETSRFCGDCGSRLSDLVPNEKMLLALKRQQEGDPDQARGILREIAPDDTWYPVALRLRGHILYRQGQVEGAIDCFKKALGVGKNDVDVWYDLGVALYHAGDVEKARDAYQKALEIDPDYHAAHYRLGITLYHLGKLQKALASFEKAQMLTPEYAMASYHIGVILGRLGRFEEAKQRLETYLEYHPWDAPTKYHLGMLSARLGDRAAAERYLAGVPEFKSGIPQFPQQ